MFQTIGHLIIYAPPPSYNPGAGRVRFRRQQALPVLTEGEVGITVNGVVVRTAWLTALPDSVLGRYLTKFNGQPVDLPCASREVAYALDIEDIKACIASRVDEADAASSVA